MNVDTPSPITHVSLCAGYGGIDLGLKRAIPTLRTIAFSEIEAFACANLVAKMEAGLLDPAPIWTDLKRFPWSDFRDRVDILSGGYPCQPFSAAGKRLGQEDPRHLWPHISAGIALMRPRCCFFENVEGHISLGLPNVIEDLGRLGYRTTWGIFSAAEVGAPHQRKRVFILAYDGNNPGAHFWPRFIDSRGGSEAAHFPSQASDEQERRSGVARRWQDPSSYIGISSNGCAELADSQCQGLEGFNYRHSPAEQAEYVGADAWASGERGAWDAWPSRPGEQQHGWEPPRVVVDAKGQRANGGQQLCEPERGSRSALQRKSDGSGEEGAALANDHSPHAGHGAQRPERQQRDLSGGCGEEVANAISNGRSEAKRDAGTMVRAECSKEGGEPKPWNATQAADVSGAGAMGNSTEQRCEGRRGTDDPRGTTFRPAIANGSCTNGAMESEQRQTQPPLGRDFDGPAGRLGYAELCVSCDNRTDELRLLGNGVVPATAERAFRTLAGELIGGPDGDCGGAR